MLFMITDFVLMLVCVVSRYCVVLFLLFGLCSWVTCNCFCGHCDNADLTVFSCLFRCLGLFADDIWVVCLCGGVGF